MSSLPLRHDEAKTTPMYFFMCVHVYAHSFKGDTMQSTSNIFQVSSLDKWCFSDSPQPSKCTGKHNLSVLRSFPWGKHQYGEAEFRSAGSSPGSRHAWLVFTSPCPTWCTQAVSRTCVSSKGGRQGALRGNWSKRLSSQATKEGPEKWRTPIGLRTPNILI